MTKKFYADIYEDLYSKHGYHNSNELDSTHYPSLFSSCLVPAKIEYETVLDIGCSTGLGIKYFFETQGKVCRGIDVSKTAIEKAGARGVRAKLGSMTDIPFDDHSFDLVCSTDVVEHVKPEDQDAAHRECFRVSKRYVAHKISNTPEGNQFAGKNLHLTCWSHDQWLDFFQGLGLDNWTLIYKITSDIWDSIKNKVYHSKKPPEYKQWIHHNTVVVFERLP